MKERILHEDEFEKQLREKADQFKMYPSDKVWNEVHSSLHTRRRRFVAGMSVLVGGILILAGSQLIYPSKNTSGKILASKAATPVKTTTVADLHNYTASAFTSPEAGQAENQETDENLHAKVPFVHRGSSGMEVPEVLSNSLASAAEKTQIAEHPKMIQQSGAGVSGKAIAPIPEPDQNETTPMGKPSSAFNSLSSESITDNTATHLTHTRNERFSWEIYVVPGFNMHYLNNLNLQSMQQAIPTSPIMVVHVANVNGFVDNTPVLGYDIGGNILYRVSKMVSLKAGLDFSFSRYYIRAYDNGPSSSSVALSSYYGYVSNSQVNSASGAPAVSKNPQQYQNRYYSLSLPVGVDMNVAGSGKLQLHVGATLQPTYLLNTDAYVLSDDYSSYVKDAQAFRRWNLNAGAELYLSYAVGKVRWELGPQLRYQIFSTYKNSIPLQENMLNYGIRIGISKSIR